MSTIFPVTPATLSAVPIAVVPLPRLDENSAGLLMTPEEFDAVTDYDDEHCYELIHGVLVVNPIPLEAEAEPNELLGRLFGNYQEFHVRGAALDLTLSERYIYLSHSRRRADRVVWTGFGRRPNPKVDVPSIIVEFVSASRRDWQRDYIEKRREYRELGVKEYWIIDRFRRTLTVFLNEAGREIETVISEDKSYSTGLLPGFELPLARLLGTADKWSTP